MMQEKKLIKNSIKTYVILGIIFILAGCSIAIIGNWTLSVNRDALSRVYSFRLFSRGNFQIITANLKSASLLSQGLHEKSLQKVEEGYLHLESAYGFLLSINSEFYLQDQDSIFSDDSNTYDQLLTLYSIILKDPYSKESEKSVLDFYSKIEGLNNSLSHAEAKFWIQRANDFETIRLRNNFIENIYWVLILSFLVGLIILVYFTIERLKLESLIERQRTRMVANSRLSALGQFAAGVAHEINNPLTVILWRIKNLKKSLAETLEANSKAKSDIDSIQINASRIEKIIKSTKTLSKNACEDKKEKLLISSLRDQINDILSPKISTENFTFTFESSCIDQSILVREVQIIQVIVNLINNSIDAIKDLEQKWIRLEVSKIDNEVIISVTDSGEGISKKLQSQLFNLFFTTKADSKDNSGIGLALSHQIVKEHGGSLTYNTKSHHTQFVMTIPLND